MFDSKGIPRAAKWSESPEVIRNAKLSFFPWKLASILSTEQ
jgi:hypothetical protein